MSRILIVLTVFLAPLAARAGPLFMDDFADVDAWTASGSDGVEVSVQADSAEGDEAHPAVLRVDFDFKRGSGFAVFRRDVAIDLPENWSLAFDLRGECRTNNFEVKLIDETGENVWWVNNRNHEFMPLWAPMSFKKRHFSFAWGPGGAEKPLTRISAIEFAVTAGSGGTGSVWIDNLLIEEAPMVSVDGPVRIRVTSASPGREPPAVLPADGVIDWQSSATDESPCIELDFGGLREFGGISIDWGDSFPRHYGVVIVRSATHASNISVLGTNGGADHVPIGDAECIGAVISCSRLPGEPPLEIRRIRIRGRGFSSSVNAFLSAVAAESPRGWYPRSFIGEQIYWTVVGAPGAEHEALLSEDGAIELFKGGPTIEPFMLLDNRLITWNDATVTQRLDWSSPFPTPVVEWSVPGLTLTIAASAAADGSTRGTYVIRNTGPEPVEGRFALALRPLQVLPPTHELNMNGGWAACGAVGTWQDGMRVKERSIVFAPSGWTMHASMFSEGESVEWLAAGADAPKAAAADDWRLASGVALRGFSLPAGESLTCQFLAKPSGQPRDSTPDAPTSSLDRVSFNLPPSAQRYADTFRAQIACILINRDGPAIQPGSRAYDRTWIRDGALTSTALLYAGFTDEVREFIDWFAPFQYDSGKIPCCADERGPDPVPEHDSHGQYIYAVAEYDRFMRDDAFVRAHLPRVTRAVDYIESLRAQRMTDQYRNAEGLERAKFGLVPESISHEGYSAKPMHSYWDDFWTLRGLEDAAYLARRAGDAALEARSASAAESMRACLYDSIRLAASIKGVNYVPGCVELGDFDPTSTSIGIFPVGEIGRIPEPLLTNTFDRYIRWFDDRAEGRLEWKDYTPYEIRNTTTFLFLNRREVTHRMMDFFFKDQRPAGWLAWAEVVRNGYRTPGFIGDLPHTWVGSDFVKLLRTMFVHERSDGALVLGMGITRDWMTAEGGASAAGLPTHYGVIGLSFFERDGARVVQIRGDILPPPGGVVIALEDLAGRRIHADGVVVTLSEDGSLKLPWPAREITIR